MTTRHTISTRELHMGHLNMNCEFMYAGSNPQPVLRSGRLEKITIEYIVVEMTTGGFKSFTCSKITDLVLVD
jgi:hypothetical protein